MNKLILIFAFACFFFFSAQVKAQNDIPELILEETEDGYIIVNWEDTRVEDEEPQQGGDQIPELILEETEGGYVIVNWEDTRVEDEEATQPTQGETTTPSSSGNGKKTKKTSKSVKKSVKVSTKKPKRSLRGESNN